MCWTNARTGKLSGWMQTGNSPNYRALCVLFFEESATRGVERLDLDVDLLLLLAEGVVEADLVIPSGLDRESKE